MVQIIDRRPNGRYRARYTAPDPHGLSQLPPEKRRITAPGTFSTKSEADAWLAEQQASISRGTWRHPDELAAEAVRANAEEQRRAVTVGNFAEKVIATKIASGKLGARAAYDYRNMWRAGEPKRKGMRAKPAGRLHEFADRPIGEVTRQEVLDWHDAQITTGKLTMVARCYDHLRGVFAAAVDRELIDKNPCTIKGAAKASTGRKRLPPTDDELAAVIEAMPAALRSLVVTAAATGQRYGELTALCRKDFTIERDDAGAVDAVRVAVTKATSYVPGEARSVKDPKTEAGVREVAVFGADALVIAAQLETLSGDAALLWEGREGAPLPHSSFTHHWEKAREAAGRPDLELHSLRHYHGTRYAQLSGATLAEVMQRLGHRSISAAMRYQHAGGRADELARRAAR